MEKISNTKFYILNFLFLTTPFIQFFQTNFVEVAFYLSDIIKIFVLVFFFYLLIVLLIKKKEIIIALSFLYFILFQFAFFNLVFNQTISLLIIFVFFIIFTKYFINNNLIINFFVIFLSINTLFFFLNLVLNNDSKLEKFINLNEDNNLEEKLISNPKNIYLIIPDEMIAIKHFENVYDLKLNNKYKNNFAKLGARYIDGTTSKAEETAINFINLLQLSEVEINNDYKDYHSLIKYYFNNPQKSKLLKFLYKNKYQLKLIGNPFMDCDTFDESLCLKSRNKKFINFYVLNTFLSASPYSFLREHIKKFVKAKYAKKLSSRYKNLYYENDAIGKFLNSSIDFVNLKKPHFFLIHHLSPHDPHFFNEDCSFRDKILDPNWKISDDYRDGYKSAYYCTLKKIINLIEYLGENDEDGIVIVQSDTGLDPNGPLSNYYPVLKNSNIEIFSLAKSNNNCQNEIPKNSTNIEIIEFMIKCNFGL